MHKPTARFVNLCPLTSTWLSAGPLSKGRYFFLPIEYNSIQKYLRSTVGSSQSTGLRLSYFCVTFAVFFVFFLGGGGCCWELIKGFHFSHSNFVCFGKNDRLNFGLNSLKIRLEKFYVVYERCVTCRFRSGKGQQFLYFFHTRTAHQKATRARARNENKRDTNSETDRDTNSETDREIYCGLTRNNNNINLNVRNAGPLNRTITHTGL